MSNKDEEENFGFLSPDHQLMAPLQEKYAKQLIEKVQRLDLDLKDIMAQQKRVEKEREETGLRLYNAQQQLADNQAAYEKAHDNYNIIQKLRIQAEQKQAQSNETYGLKKQEAMTLKANESKKQKELENLMKHYHEIQAYNLQLKSDIAVTRTETFTAEQTVANLEKVKKKQDLLIDSMNEEIKRLEEQKNILSAQLVSQKEETEQARKILRDAQMEMGRIVASKKSLLERWQRSLADMQKMDATLQFLKDSFKEQNQINILLKTELNGVKTETRKEEAKTEKTMAESNRLTNERNALELKKNQLRAQKEQILHQSILLENSLKNTEEEIKKVDLEKKTIDDSMNLIETNIMKLHTETKRLLEDLINQKGEHTAIEKTASNLLKQARGIELEVEEKEVELENLMNQIARIRIDQLNTKSQIELLEEKKNQIIKEKLDKELLVATYEIQIRQGHDLNEKKQHEVGRLNKQHDELVSNANDESKSPLENKHINLVRETQELDKVCAELYRDWIKKQTTLVHQNNKLQELGEAVSSLQNKKTILQQKKARLNTNYQSFEKEITTIQISLKGLQNDMNKLNDGLAVNYDKRNKLENENVNIQSEFGQKLRDLERESVNLEVQIDRLREEKAGLLDQIVQSERHIELWERKYQLEKEMQETLDPNVGQSQIEELKKEIHRMQLKLSSIKKAQEEIQSEMLRIVDNTEIIRLRYSRRSQTNEAGKVVKQPENSNQLTNAIKSAKSNLAKTIKAVQDVDRNLDARRADLEQFSAAINQSNQALAASEQDNYQLQNDLLMAKTEKAITTLSVLALQSKYRKQEEIMNKTAKLSFQEPVLRTKVQELQSNNEAIYQAVAKAAEQFPQYSGVLSMLLNVSEI